MSTKTERAERDHNVEFVSSQVIECRECGHRWSLNIQTGGGMPRGWWRCPEGCNEPND